MGVECRFRELVWPEADDLVVETVDIVGDSVRVEAGSRRDDVTCPDCGSAGTRVHSRYRRRLADRPLGGRCVVLRLLVRRFARTGSRHLARSLRPARSRLPVVGFR
ncbi:transposase family protein [Streptomyces sp. NPDC041003]|uniref:transposase family protein n=1 Tax=Streptomyces sp. NPDC041003 TaxID=3155730 RepID=UPI0033F0AC40